MKKALLLVALLTSYYALSATAGAQCINDDFNLPDGSPPDPAIWVTDQDCDMGNVVIDVQGQQLHQYANYVTACIPGGGPGVGVYTVATFDCFDMQIVYEGSSGPGFGYWKFGALCTADLPWSTHTPPSTDLTGFAGGPPGHVAAMYAAGYGFLGNTPPINPGDIIRVVGVPGGSLEFYQNGTLVYSMQQWNPPCNTFAAVVYSRPGGTIGEYRHTYWDDFSLCFPCAGLVLSDPSPGRACTLNRMDTTGATPGASVYLTYGFQSGSTPVPGCTSLFVDILQPEVAGSVVADQNGVATFLGNVPCGAQGRVILFQAVELQTCRKSNLVAHQF